MSSDLQQIRTQIDQMRSQFHAALPAHIPAERFGRVVMTAVQLNPNLASSPKSLLAAAMRCAADGLLPDGREAALVMFKQDVAYMPMVSGILKKVHQGGSIVSLTAHVVYERDQFDYELGDEERIVHRPSLHADRGSAIGVYAIARTKEGAIYREVMSVADVEKVRSVSRAKDSGPWNTWWSEMARKTVIRRLAKRLPLSSEADEVIRRDDALYEVTAQIQEPATTTSAVAAINEQVRRGRPRKGPQDVVTAAAPAAMPEAPVIEMPPEEPADAT